MSYEENARELFGILCRRPEDDIPIFPANGFRGQFILLRCLMDGERFAGDLASELEVTSGRIAVAIKRLEAMGLVTRRKGDTDGRRTAITLTEAGRAAFVAHEARAQGFLAQRLRCLTEAEAAEFIRLMRKMRQSGNPDDSQQGSTQEELC